MSAAAPPDRVIVQKHGTLELRFEFRDAALTQTVSDRKAGSKSFREFDLTRLPDESHFRSQMVRPGLLGVMALALLVSVAQFALYPQAPLLCLAFGVVATALVWSGYRAFGFRLAQRRTDIPVDGQVILILQDSAHDDILTEIRERREGRLAARAVVMPAETKRQNLLRLRTLAQMGVLTERQYLAFQQDVVPHVSESFLRKPDSSKDDLDIEQARLGIRCRFEFREGYVRYARSDMTGRNSLTISYLDLPNLERLDQVSVRSPALVLAQMVGLVATVCASLEVVRHRPHLGLPSFGAEGFFDVALALFPIFGAFALLSHSLRRGVRCTQIPPGFPVLPGADHDAILSEMARRQRTALQAFAELDPLLPLAEQERRVSIATRVGLLSGDEARERMQQAVALQRRLDLDTAVETTQTTQSVRPAVFH
jgi:hypothetical protein